MPKVIIIDEKEVCELYKDGKSLENIGNIYMISPTTVRCILKNNNIKISMQGKKKSHKKNKKRIDLLDLIGFDEFTYGK